MQPYNLPLRQKSSLSRRLHALLISCIIFLFGFSSLFLFWMIEDEPGISIFFGILFLLFGVFVGYIYVSAALLKTFYLEVTEDALKFFSGFKTHTAKWNEIYEAQAYSYNNNTALAILLEKDRLKKAKRTLNNNLNSMTGTPPMSFSLPIRFFSDIDIDRLLLTMQAQMDKHYAVTYVEDSKIAEYEEQFQNNLFKALSMSFLSSIVIGIGYGFSIQLLHKNFLAIPMFGSLLVIGMFNKYYVEEYFNIFIRLSLGVLCLLQMFTGMITAEMLFAKLHITILAIQVVTENLIEDVFSSPGDYVAIFIGALMCFGMGVFKTRVRRR